MIKTTHLKQVLSLFLCVVLIAAMALIATGCNDDKAGGDPPSATTTPSNVTVKGTGATVFSFSVTDKAGKTTHFEIHTDKTVVGEALQELGLIDGEEGPYGLYVKTVTGETVDYDTDGKYWAFYINGKLAPSGVDTTPIQAEESYAFKVE